MDSEVKREKWAFLQEVNGEDVADSIFDSLAVGDAVHNNDWVGLAKLVKTRIDLKAQRIAEYRVLDRVVTPWIDQGEERANYKLDYSRRVEAMFRRENHEKQDQFGRNFGGTS